jgi:tetratricopeptide (TPR) repeat protein
MSLENLGEFYRRTERYREAEAMHRRALRIAEATWGTDSLALENPLKSLAGLSHRDGRYAEAFAYYDRIVALVGKQGGNDSPVVAAYLVVMAELLRFREMAEPATREARRALDIVERALGPDDANIPTVLTELVWDLQIVGRSEDAAKYGRRLRAMLATPGSRAPAVLRSALKYRKDVLGPRHPSVAKALADMALALEVQGDIGQADLLYREATGILEGAGFGGSDIIPLLEQHAALLHTANRLSAARLIEARIEALRATARK